MKSRRLPCALVLSLCTVLLQVPSYADTNFDAYTKGPKFTVGVTEKVTTYGSSYAANGNAKPYPSLSQTVNTQTSASLNRHLTEEELKAIQREEESYDFCRNLLKDQGSSSEVAELCKAKSAETTAEIPAGPSEEEIRQEIYSQVHQQFSALSVAPAKLHHDTAPNTLKNYHTNIYASAEPQEFVQEILGRQVTIRAVPITYTFDYGDGSTLGPTRNPGYSVGDEWDVETPTSHQYKETGSFYYSVRTDFRGEYRVGEGNWQVIEGTASTSTEPERVEVWRVRAGKVADSCAKNPQAWGCR